MFRQVSGYVFIEYTDPRLEEYSGGIPSKETCIWSSRSWLSVKRNALGIGLLIFSSPLLEGRCYHFVTRTRYRLKTPLYILLLAYRKQ